MNRTSTKIIILIADSNFHVTPNRIISKNNIKQVQQGIATNYSQIYIVTIYFYKFVSTKSISTDHAIKCSSTVEYLTER